MRKVMVFVPNLEIGGAQKMALELVRWIRNAHGDVVFQILVLRGRQGTALEKTADEENVDVVYLGKPRGLHPGYVVRAYRAMRRFRPDVVHAHLPVIHYILPAMSLCRVRARYYTVHSLADRDAGSHAVRAILRFAFHRCGVCPVALSEFCRDSVAKEYGLPEERIPCVLSGIDLRAYARKTPYPELPCDTVRFVAVGRLSPEKNYPLMINAFGETHAACPRARLLILGGGELRDELERLRDKSGLHDAITFGGAVANVGEYLVRAHAFVMSSDWEGIPLSVLEATAAELPIVSTKAGGVVDVVEAEGNGCLVGVGNRDALAEEMTRLAGDADLRERFSRRSAVLARGYGIEKTAEAYYQLYLKEFRRNGET